MDKVWVSVSLFFQDVRMYEHGQVENDCTGESLRRKANDELGVIFMNFAFVLWRWCDRIQICAVFVHTLRYLGPRFCEF